MSVTVNIQEKFRCTECKAASDIFGRNCKHDAMFPLLLLMAGMNDCPNFELDVNKIEEQLKRKENGTEDRRSV